MTLIIDFAELSDRTATTKNEQVTHDSQSLPLSTNVTAKIGSSPVPLPLSENSDKSTNLHKQINKQVDDTSGTKITHVWNKFTPSRSDDPTLAPLSAHGFDAEGKCASKGSMMEAVSSCGVLEAVFGGRSLEDVSVNRKVRDCPTGESGFNFCSKPAKWTSSFSLTAAPIHGSPRKCQVVTCTTLHL